MSSHRLLFILFMALIAATSSSNMSLADHLFGNVDADLDVDLQDAVLSLRVVSGGVLSEAINKEADVDGDLRVGVAEAVHAMRVAAGFPVAVDSLLDLADPPAGTTTLRAALERAAPGQRIVFDPSLDGGTVLLSIVGETHTILKGEVMGMEMTPSGPVSYLEGYFERDYGRSALYAKKDVVIDASDLDSGITLEWTGGESEPARVLAIYGDLALLNVDITGGRSVAEDISAREPEDQPWTLGRGGGVAVWGKAVLEDCALYDNHCVGDFDQSRDRGAFGGGLYADIVEMKNCVASGNTVTGAGAAGGGVYSVGGAEHYQWTSYIEQSAVTGNRISGIFVYGGGVYSDGGSIGNRKTLSLENTTVAWNVAEPSPGLPSFLLGMGYWRGAGIYMSNGYLRMRSCTVAENTVYGVPRPGDLDKANLAGGIAATIGNAHAVETMDIAHCIVVGNTVVEIDVQGDPPRSYEHDLFTGSLLHFRSKGHNRFGVIDFSQILVPVGEEDWESLARKHYPKEGDQGGMNAEDVLDLESAARSDTILSAGANLGEFVVLHYPPRGNAVDRVPSSYYVDETYEEYSIAEGATDNFLEIILGRIEALYTLADFARNFTADFETYLQSVDTDDETEGNQPYLNPDGDPILTLADTLWFGPAETWPSNVSNYPYIAFWHRLDAALEAENIPGMGAELLGDAQWAALFASGPLSENADIAMEIMGKRRWAVLPNTDQVGHARPADGLGDIGAIEVENRTLD